MRVLVAEDNAVNQKLVRRLLEKNGYSVLVAENGHVALEAFRQHTFDLVLMDLQMPVMGGLEATRNIRSLERSIDRRTPIIAVTAFSEQCAKESCFEAGMDEYLTKPLDTGKLLSAIQRHLPAPVVQPHFSAAASG
jgi:CheY-like chemotaxis protein